MATLVVGGIALAADAIGLFSFLSRDPLPARTYEMTEDIRTLLLDKLRVDRAALERQYPLGYAIVYTDRHETLIPHQTLEPRGWRADFSNLRVTALPYNKIELTVPDFFDAEGRRVTHHRSILGGDPGTRTHVLRLGGVEMLAEVLTHTQDEIAVVVGLRPERG